MTQLLVGQPREGTATQNAGTVRSFLNQQIIFGASVPIISDKKVRFDSAMTGESHIQDSSGSLVTRRLAYRPTVSPRLTPTSYDAVPQEGDINPLRRECPLCGSGLQH